MYQTTRAGKRQAKQADDDPRQQDGTRKQLDRSHDRPCATGGPSLKLHDPAQVRRVPRFARDASTTRVASAARRVCSGRSFACGYAGLVRQLHYKRSMETAKDVIRRELETLQQTRDDLRVRLHLASSDMKDVWDNLERKWLELEDNTKQLAHAQEPTAQKLSDAARLLMTEIRNGYLRLIGP